MVPLSLSYDHRVIDGALAARFVAHLVGRALRPAAGAALMRRRGQGPRHRRLHRRPGHRGAGRGRATRWRSRTRWSRSSPTRRRWRSRRRRPGKVGRAQGRGRRHASPRARVILLLDAGDGGRRRPMRPRRPPTRRRPRRRAPRRRRPTRDVTRPGRRARRRAGRLHGGVPRRRPRAAGRADRPRRDARRRLPERRLHPVQGAAARRARCSTEAEELGDVRHLLRRAEDRHRHAARLEGRRRRAG